MILGSAAAIAFGLITSLIVFLFLEGKYPQFTTELPILAISSFLFTTVAGVAAVAFYGLQKQCAWRWNAQILMWCVVLAAGWYSWPKRL